MLQMSTSEVTKQLSLLKELKAEKVTLEDKVALQQEK